MDMHMIRCLHMDKIFSSRTLNNIQSIKWSLGQNKFKDLYWNYWLYSWITPEELTWIRNEYIVWITNVGKSANCENNGITCIY